MKIKNILPAFALLLVFAFCFGGFAEPAAELIINLL